jgi:HK97 family phage prohead protease
MELVRAMRVDDLEVTGRTLEGQALRFDTLYSVSDDGGRRWYQEGFRRRAFETSIARRGWFELRPEHVDERIGQVSFREGQGGLIFTAAIEPGDRGDVELELVRAGLRSGVSIRYAPQKAERDAPPWWRTKVDLRELSLTAHPQYGADAKVTALRSHSWQRPDGIDALLDWQPPEL